MNDLYRNQDFQESLRHQHIHNLSYEGHYPHINPNQKDSLLQSNQFHQQPPLSQTSYLKASILSLISIFPLSFFWLIANRFMTTIAFSPNQHLETPSLAVMLLLILLLCFFLAFFSLISMAVDSFLFVIGLSIVLSLTYLPFSSGNILSFLIVSVFCIGCCSYAYTLRELAFNFVDPTPLALIPKTVGLFFFFFSLMCAIKTYDQVVNTPQEVFLHQISKYLTKASIEYIFLPGLKEINTESTLDDVAQNIVDTFLSENQTNPPPTLPFIEPNFLAERKNEARSSLVHQLQQQIQTGLKLSDSEARTITFYAAIENFYLKTLESVLAPWLTLLPIMFSLLVFSFIRIVTSFLKFAPALVLHFVTPLLVGIKVVDMVQEEKIIKRFRFLQ